MIRSEIVVILVNYNGLDVTKDCLKSIRENESKLPFVILVDNNSKNSSQLDQLKNDYSLLEIIRNEQNVGFGRANNIGIKWALENIDFDYLILLNNDTIVTKNAV